MVEPSDELQVVFEKAIKDAKKLRHEYVTLEHLFFAMLCCILLCLAMFCLGGGWGSACLSVVLD